MTAPSNRPARLTPRGIALIFTCTFLWAIGPLFIKYFTHFYNAWTQNAFRYLVAAAILFGLALFRGGLRHPLSSTQWGKLAMIAAVNITLQIFYALGYYFIYPSVAALVGQTNIFFVILLSFIIFHDERAVIRSPRFIAGAILALAGVVIVTLARDPQLLQRFSIAEHDFWIGVGCILIYAFFLGAYSIAIKRAVKDIPPFISFVHVAWMTALGLSLPMLVLGGWRDLVTSPPLPLALMALTALLCIVIAHLALYAALREVAAVVAASIMQTLPVMTCIFSALVYGDTLNVYQIAGGVAVVTGAWFAAMAQAQAAGQAAPEPADS